MERHVSCGAAERKVSWEVVRLLDGPLGPAYHQVVWDSRDSNRREVPSGLYIARLIARPAGKPAFTKSVKMVLLR